MAVEAKAMAWPPLAFPLAVTSGRFYTLFFFYIKVQKFGVKTTVKVAFSVTNLYCHF